MEKEKENETRREEMVGSSGHFKLKCSRRVRIHPNHPFARSLSSVPSSSTINPTPRPFPAVSARDYDSCASSNRQIGARRMEVDQRGRDVVGTEETSAQRRGGGLLSNR